MRDHHRYQYDRREFHQAGNENAAIVLTLVVLIIVSAFTYLLIARFHIRISQLLELSCYVFVPSAATLRICLYLIHRRTRCESAWPHPPVFIPMLKDRTYVRRGFEQNSIVPGYDIHSRPWCWSDEVRRMQAIVVGQSGSGKTTLLQNIATQDIQRRISGQHLPLIIFDGKGDREFLSDLLFEIAAAGRLDQLRVLDPFRPEISDRFNPLYGKTASHQELVNAFFESFSIRQDFFRGHQAAYFSDLNRVLHYTGKVYNIPDVLVMAQDELVMKEQIAQARYIIENQPGVSAQRRQNFEMSVRNLLQSLKDRERVPKIQGLLNELMTFTQDDLSLITNAYDGLFTFDEVVENGLILFVSLNTNKNTKAVTALGRMILQNLQLLVGQRYLEMESHQGCRPMVSVILDEFAPFAYPNFAQVLQTARGSNIALLFSIQSIPQLRSVSRSFGDDVSSAPNTTMLLRTRDQETANYFLNASAQVPAERRTLTVERIGFFEKRYEEIGLGSITQIEKSRAVDYHIKNLPLGQMQVLTTHSQLGTLHMHIHVRRPKRYRLRSFEPVVYPSPRRIGSEDEGANLRFKNPELARRMGRIFGRNRIV